MIKTARVKPSVDHLVLRWGGSFEELQEVGQRLGALGIMFQVNYRTKGTATNNEYQFEDVFPELVVYDNRFRPHTATYNNYVIVGPGHRNVRVLDRVTYNQEFEQ